MNLIERDITWIRRQLDLHRKDAGRCIHGSYNNRPALDLKVARYCGRTWKGEVVPLIYTTRSICASMLAGRARIIAEMHNWRARLERRTQGVQAKRVPLSRLIEMPGGS